MPVGEETYERVALEDPEGRWELHCGRLQRKPDMSFEHSHIARLLGYRLQSQLSFDLYEVAVDHSRLRRAEASFFIPDVMVIPAELVADGRRTGAQRLEVYSQPLPLVVEVWSPSTGTYDVNVKLEEYQRRGDLEIWRIHPYEKTLTAWRRQPDGSYVETIHRGGVVHLRALPEVRVDLDELFAQ
jgi:Uma2 family endonuclease